jgi:hypothetical protein
MFNHKFGYIFGVEDFHSSFKGVICLQVFMCVILFILIMLGANLIMHNVC